MTPGVKENWERWSMAEVDINPQKQTQKQMQPRGGLNKNSPPRHSNIARCPPLLTSKLLVQVSNSHKRTHFNMSETQYICTGKEINDLG